MARKRVSEKLKMVLLVVAMIIWTAILLPVVGVLTSITQVAGFLIGIPFLGGMHFIEQAIDKL